MKGKDKIIKIVSLFLFLSVISFVCFRYSGQVIYVFSHIAVKSALTYFPEKAFQKDTEAESTSSEKESETKKETEPTAKAEEKTTVTETKSTTVKDKAEKKEDFFVLPTDISEMTKQAIKKVSGEEKGGTILEKQYKNEGVTDKYGAVKIKNTNSTKINTEEILKEKADLKIDKDEPAVLIFHTHTTESYQYIDRDYYAANHPSRNNSSDRNMVRIGKAIASQIEKAGYKVIHAEKIHDGKYSGAYSRSRQTVEEYLKKYPSIKVVLDVHRDAIEQSSKVKIKPTATINGRKTAQVMIITGCQESNNAIEGFPNWRKNLTFAVHLQNEMEKSFPGLTRPVFFCPRKYNMDLTTCSLLLEIGRDANTLEEAYYAGLCVGKSVAQLLKKYEV